MAKNEKTAQTPETESWSPPELPKWIFSHDSEASSDSLSPEDLAKIRKEAFILVQTELEKSPNHEEEIKAFYAQLVFENLPQISLMNLYNDQAAANKQEQDKTNMWNYNMREIWGEIVEKESLGTGAGASAAQPVNHPKQNGPATAATSGKPSTNNEAPQTSDSQTWSPSVKLPKPISELDSKANTRITVEVLAKIRKEAFILVQTELEKSPNHEEEIKAFYAQLAFKNLPQTSLMKLYDSEVTLLTKRAAYQSKKSPTTKSDPKLVEVAKMPDNTPSNPQDIRKYRKMAFELIHRELSKLPIGSKGLSKEDRKKNIANRNRKKSLYQTYGFEGIRQSISKLSEAYIADLSKDYWNEATAYQGAGVTAANQGAGAKQTKKRKYVIADQETGGVATHQGGPEESAQEMGAPTNPVFSLSGLPPDVRPLGVGTPTINIEAFLKPVSPSGTVKSSSKKENGSTKNQLGQQQKGNEKGKGKGKRNH